MHFDSIGKPFQQFAKMLGLSIARRGRGRDGTPRQEESPAAIKPSQDRSQVTGTGRLNNYGTRELPPLPATPPNQASGPRAKVERPSAALPLQETGSQTDLAPPHAPRAPQAEQTSARGNGTLEDSQQAPPTSAPPEDDRKEDGGRLKSTGRLG